MDDEVTPKKVWAQRLNYIKNCVEFAKKYLHPYRGPWSKVLETFSKRKLFPGPWFTNQGACYFRLGAWNFGLGAWSLLLGTSEPELGSGLGLALEAWSLRPSARSAA
jgi:hypothetical protein